MLRALHRRLRFEMQVISRKATMDAGEEELHNSLVAFVGGTRLVVTPEEVTGYLIRYHGITTEEALVRHYKDDSFLVSFNDARLVDRVLHSPPPAGADLGLVFGHYCRQTDTLFTPLRFKVLVALENIPAHVWLRETA
jgi:hypothetical protein